jgi:hypothetical protein
MQSPGALGQLGAATIARCGEVAQLVEHTTENRVPLQRNPSFAVLAKPITKPFALHLVEGRGGRFRPFSRAIATSLPLRPISRPNDLGLVAEFRRQTGWSVPRRPALANIDAMSDLISRLEAKLREHVLATMPADPAGDLEGQKLDELLLIFGNWRSRLVAPRRRRAHLAPGLRGSSKWTEHEGALEAIVGKISAGEDLTPHLSRGVEVAHVPDGSAPSALKRRGDRDLLISDWAIHHLHLGTVVETDGFVERTGDLLFAAFTDEEAYLLGVHVHGSWAAYELIDTLVENWPGSGLFVEMRGLGLVKPISEAEHLEARNAGLLQPVEVAGKLYMPPGLTGAGTPIRVTQDVHNLLRNLEGLRGRIDAELKRTIGGRFALWSSEIRGEEYGFTCRWGFVAVGRLP